MSLRETESVLPERGESDTATVILHGTALEGRYVVRGHLGRGGNCDVYRATDTLLRKDVALKILRSDRVNSHTLARLRREVAVAQQIQSPHVVRTHDLGVSGDITFIAMELVDGETLADRVERGALRVDEVVAIAAEVLQGLAAIHAKGVVHRDIKPSNLLIDGAGVVRIGDLGLARHFDTDESRLTHTEALVGTLPYISPEQVLGIKPDGRSDLYSLGVTLYECLTGQLPFARGTAVGSLASRITERAPSVRTLRRDVPTWLDAYILRLLEKEPADRFQSAEHALRSLRRKRLPLRWRKAVSPIALATALIVAAFAGWWMLRPGPCASLLPGENGFRAVDARGRTLWSFDGVAPGRAWLLNPATERAIVAVVPGRTAPLETPERTRLVLLAADTGRELRHVGVPSGEGPFPDFDARFNLSGTIVDVNRDGADELLLRFSHTYWPWYAALFDSASETAGLVYFSTGHQSAVTTADLDGDGTDEILFAGKDNLMGWYSSLAMIEIGPRITKEQLGYAKGACSPMVARIGECAGGVKGWHTLLRRGNPYHIDVDTASRTIRVSYDSGAVELVRFDGRPVNSTVSPEAAQSHRLAAYDRLRSAGLLERTGQFPAARAEVHAALADAVASGDIHLAEWTQTLLARLSIRTGDVATGERLARELMARPESAAETAFELGRALYLVGDYPAAARYFTAGLYEDKTAGGGRLKYEFIEGALFALVAAGAIAEADELILNAPESMQDAAGARGRGAHFRAAIRFLSGQEFDAPLIELSGPMTDLWRYWNLEFAWKRSHDAEAILSGLRAETARDGSLDGLLLSLEAEVLDASGRRNDAAEKARAARLWVERMRTTDMIACAHERIVQERYERIAGSGR